MAKNTARMRDAFFAISADSSSIGRVYRLLVSSGTGETTAPVYSTAPTERRQDVRVSEDLCRVRRVFYGGRQSLKTLIQELRRVSLAPINEESLADDRFS